MQTPTHETSIKTKVLNSISYFLQSNAKFLIVIGVVFFVAISALIIYREISENKANRSAYFAEQAQELFKEWKNASEEEADAIEKELNKTLEKIFSQFSGYYAEQRALLIKGDLHFQKEQWIDAAENYRKLEEKFPKSYLAPLSLFNAAVCYEELGGREKAMKTYTLLIDAYKEDAPEIPHAYFSLGRLSEKEQEFTKAKEYYDTILDNYNFSDWTNLARDRIIYLIAKGKIEEE